EKVWFMPNNKPPHKKHKQATCAHRIGMLEALIQATPYIELYLDEINNQRVSYTYDTLLALRKKYPETKFYFIIGADMVEYLPKWHRIDELVAIVSFVAVARPGYSLQSDYPISIIQCDEMPISSSLIRNAVVQGESIARFVPQTVEDYIKEHDVYGFLRT
ncbi:MAG: nicotinate (nicotinamide) nucleotide adenylyltransferase, partial [Bacilli bacterium]